MFNQTIVVGYVGRDPELRYTAEGVAVANFSIATNRRWTDRDGQVQERTTWFRVTAWRKLAELCNQYLAKGRLVLVQGEVKASAWTSQEGEPRATLELTANNVRFLGGRGDNGATTAADASIPPAIEEEIPF